MQVASFLRRIILSSVARLAPTYHYTLSHKWQDFPKKEEVNQRKMCFDFLQTFV